MELDCMLAGITAKAGEDRDTRETVVICRSQIFQKMRVKIGSPGDTDFVKIITHVPHDLYSYLKMC